MIKKMSAEEVDLAVLQQDLVNLRKEARFFKEVKVTRDGGVFDSTGAGGSMVGARAHILSEIETDERVFALVFKKKTHHKDVFIVIDGTDYMLSIHVPAEEEGRARAWKSRFNTVTGRMS